MQDWLGRVDWARRPAELGELRKYTDATDQRGVVIITPLPTSHPTAKRWRRLPASPLLLQPLQVDHAGYLVLRYAAIDTSRERVALDWQSDLRRVATWGVEISHALEHLVASVPKERRGYVACPAVFVDLAGHIRLGLVGRDATRLPPDVNATWPACDERGLVYVAGLLLSELLDLGATPPTHPIAELVRRCMSREPVYRHRTLEALRTALLDLGGTRQSPVVDPQAWRGWLEAERGIGLLLAGETAEAMRALRGVIVTTPEVKIAREVFDVILASEPVRGARAGEVVWGEVATMVRELEAVRDHRGALEILRTVMPEPESVLARCLAIARCLVETGELGEALDELRKVLAVFPDHVEARSLRARALLGTDRADDALAACDAWLAVAPDDGAAHHARGKALLALGRPADARASFDRATQLAPGLVAAAMLRTNLDRKARDLRRDVGLDAHRQLEVPAHLPELAPILAQGRILDAIVWLTDRYDDLAARRLLATCHEYAGDLDAALVVYEHLADPHGMARCLIELGRAEEALALLDDTATELRADALDRLGRTAEAAEVRQHIAWER